jgi:SAM-dependent methyltransferase
VTTAQQPASAADAKAISAWAAKALPPLPGLSQALEGMTGSFIEAGAGYGVRLRSLSDAGLLRGFSRLIVSDVRPDALQFAQALVPEAEAIRCDATSLPFENGSMDFVFSDQVIEHVPSDSAMASEIARVLRPGGRAYVGSVLKRRWAWYFYRNAGHWRLDPTHVREYASLDAYRGVFEGAGLAVQATYVEPMRFAAGEALLRLLVLARLVRSTSYYNIHASSPLLQALSNIRIPIPGYYGCWVTLDKKAAGPAP